LPSQGIIVQHDGNRFKQGAHRELRGVALSRIHSPFPRGLYILTLTNCSGGDGVCRYALRGWGPVLIAFGLGLLTAKLVPYAVFLMIAAASMILTGVLLCRC
jgi:hypothetical protein